MVKLFRTIDFFLGSMCVGLRCWDDFVFMQHVLVFFFVQATCVDVGKIL
jgi:hypothetical protein